MPRFSCATRDNKLRLVGEGSSLLCKRRSYSASSLSGWQELTNVAPHRLVQVLGADRLGNTTRLAFRCPSRLHSTRTPIRARGPTLGTSRVLAIARLSAPSIAAHRT